MIKKDRILSKIDELYGYLKELKEIAVVDYNEYLLSIEKRRACERLLQISVECVIDICSLFVSGLRLGIPADEGDIFERLFKNKIISAELRDILRSMKGFRNILVHNYAGIDNAIVYEIATSRLTDFERFIKEMLSSLQAHSQAMQ